MKNSYYSKAVKIRFKPFYNGKYPFKKFVTGIALWNGWDTLDFFLERWIGRLRYFITYPFILSVFGLFAIPCSTYAIIRNNIRILWRYFKHAIYKHSKGKQK